jgi:hypothetical protein
MSILIFIIFAGFKKQKLSTSRPLARVILILECFCAAGREVESVPQGTFRKSQYNITPLFVKRVYNMYTAFGTHVLASSATARPFEVGRSR